MTFGISSLSSRASAAVSEISTIIHSVVNTTNASLHEPLLGNEEIAEISRCVISGFVSSAGPQISEFEAMLCDFTGAKHAIAVVNGTAALHLSLLATGVAANDEVLIPALTFVGTGNAVQHAGGIPHFVDSEPNHLGIDVNKLATYLSSIAVIREGQCFNSLTGRRISHIIPVHVFGHIGDLNSLNEVAKRYRITVIEDAAEALGSQREGRHAGLFGACGVISFNGNKIITTGGGGVLITNDKSLAQRLRVLATTAKRPHTYEYWHDELAYNYRMPALNAALGIAQMKRLEAMLLAKARLSKAYENAFMLATSAKFFVGEESTLSNNWLNAIKLNDEYLTVRNKVLEGLNEIGFGCRPVWSLLCDLPHFVDCPAMELHTARNLQSRLINIPSSAVFGESLQLDA